MINKSPIEIKEFEDIYIPIYYFDKCIGECTSLRSFLNVRAQIKRLKSSDYFMEYKGVKYSISSNGELSPALPDDWYEDQYMNELIKLV